MKNYHDVNITKSIIKELESLNFVEEPTFSNFDYLTVEDDGELLIFSSEPVFERDDNCEYVQIADSRTVVYKKNGISGVYQGIEFI